jgi:hypothetical protein
MILSADGTCMLTRTHEAWGVENLCIERTQIVAKVALSAAQRRACCSIDTAAGYAGRRVTFVVAGCIQDSGRRNVN